MATLFDKIWNAHVVGTRMDGRTLVYVDRHVIHDLHAPHAFAKLRQAGRTVRRPDLTVAVTDHMVSTSAGRTDSSIAASAPFLARTRAGAAELGIRLLGTDEPAAGHRARDLAGAGDRAARQHRGLSRQPRLHRGRHRRAGPGHRHDGGGARAGNPDAGLEQAEADADHPRTACWRRT